jgi:UDP-N-acetylmuramate dehydrogenase
MATPNLSLNLNTTQHKNNLIQTNVPLHDKNWFRTGGSARFFCEPETVEELQYALLFAQQHNLPIFTLGQGANILISDSGFNGLVIRLRFTGIEHAADSSCTVKAGAGVTMHNLIDYCLEHQLLGLEEFSGIPGTVGGSVYINLHYFEFLLEQFLLCAEVIEKKTGTIFTVDPAWFKFGYNQSTLQQEDYYLVSATFKLKAASALEVAYAKGRRTEIIRHRNKRYPTSGTCGSFFRNFFEHEVTLEINGKKMIYIAYYLDKIGVKGQLRIGDALVSHQHANMLVNAGNATSTDLIMLAQKMSQLVLHQFGIVPQPECRLIGFEPWQLLVDLVD